MNWKSGLLIESEGTGISKPLSRHINLIGQILGQVIQDHTGEEKFALVEELRHSCKMANVRKDPALLYKAYEKITKCDLKTLNILLRSFSTFFHLVNKAEQLEIIRINHERELKASADSPRAESIAEAVFRLKNAGWSLEDLISHLSSLDIQPTLTAHPTEARRMGLLQKQEEICGYLTALTEKSLTSVEKESLLDQIYNDISLLLATDDIRTERLKVLDEVNFSLFFAEHSIWRIVPQIYQDLRHAIRQYYGEDSEIPHFLRFRSWIGGDRDGNPKVTPDVTRETLRIMRHSVLNLYLSELKTLRRDLSISSRLVDIPAELSESIENDAQSVSLDEEIRKFYRFEPFRIKINYMMLKIEQELMHLEQKDGAGHHPGSKNYTAAAFRKDLLLLQRCLRKCGFQNIADQGRLSSLLIQAQTFGFHFLSLDVRQHSGVHLEVVSEILRCSGICNNYKDLSKSRRTEILHEAISGKFLMPDPETLSSSARMTLDSFYVIKETLERDPDAMGLYVISMTHHVSDLLEVIFLARVTGLWRMKGSSVATALDIVPLVETIEDLEHAENLLRSIFEDPIYNLHLKARNNFQEIMLGYSDSNKDGGYWAANWALHKGQERIAAICNRYHISFRLFHGRGGTIGRGGGRANQAILAMPRAARNGRIRFTEQGEVISFRYALPEIAHRHLEQIVNAMILSVDPDDGENTGDDGVQSQLMDRLSHKSMSEYRTLIENPKFWKWYTEVTPIEHISRIPIASRPVSRSSSDEVAFEDLRAIPWVFAWTQIRAIIPGWYGVGRALDETLNFHNGNGRELRSYYKNWNFFRTVLNNAQQELARARPLISEFYLRLSQEKFSQMIMDEYDRAREAILSITDQDDLLDNRKVIQKSIHLRNPYTDVLNLIQVELIQRWRSATEEEKQQLGHAIFLSINGIAAAMQSTG